MAAIESTTTEEKNGSPSSVSGENKSEKEKTEKLTRLPMTRIKHIMKMDPDVALASQDSVLLIAKATELFIECLAKDAYSYTQQSKKKTIQRKDIDSSISAADALAFLEGTLD